MKPTIRHLRVRDGVYQFEKRVPLRIQRDTRRFAALFNSKPLYRVSLRTKNENQALEAWIREKARFERMIAEPGEIPQPPLPASGSRIITDEDLIAIGERYRQLTAEPFERLHRLANVNPAAAEELERVEYELGLDADAIRSTLKSRQEGQGDLILHPAAEARHLIASEDYNAPAGSQELGAIIAAVRAGYEQGYVRISALGNGEAIPMLPAVPKKEGGRLTLREAVRGYLDVRKPPSKAVSETNLSLRQFEEAVGNKSLAAITRDDFHTFVEYLAGQKVGGKTTGSVVRHLSEHSIRKRLRMLASAIRHAKDRGLFHGENPASDIRVATFTKANDKSVMPEKRRLQISEMNAIFAHPWFTGCQSASVTHLPGKHRLTGCEYWAPVVAAYTGCRAAELGGLKVSEVRLDHPLPHIIVRDNEYRRTKSRRSRCVPILDALLALGFAEYVEGIARAGHDRLFPDWTAIKRRGGGEGEYPAWSNAKVMRAFNRTVIPAALKDTLVAGVRQEVTFHSLRGAFKAMLGTTSNLPINIVHEVIGHAKSELDSRYIGEVTIEETYPVVRGCDYEGLIVPRCY